MRRVLITRLESGDAGVFGTLVTDSGFSCHTGELPWRDNSPFKSCIPKGVYTCRWHPSLRHGFCYFIEAVPGRFDVEIHAANLMGDVSKGLVCELEGCIALGEGVGTLRGQKALVRSQAALVAFQKDLNREPFELTITE